MADTRDPAAPQAAKSGAAAADAARNAAETGARHLKEASSAASKTAEAGRAAAQGNTDVLRGHVETAQQAMRSSLEAGARSFEGLTQNWTRAFGMAAPNADLTEQSAQNVQAVSQASSALAKGAQDASRAWMELTQRAMRSNLEAISQLASCRTMQEVVTLQSNLLRDNLQQAIESGEVIARVSSDAIQEATRAIQPPAQRRA